MYVVCSVSHYTDLTWAHSSPVQDLLNKTVEVYLILSTVRLSSKPPDLRSVFLVGFSLVTVVVWDVAVNNSWSDWSEWSSLCSGDWRESVTPLLLSTQAFCVLARRQRTASNNLKLQLLSFIVIYIGELCTTTHHHINFVVYYYLPAGEEYLYFKIQRGNCSVTMGSHLGESSGESVWEELWW